MSINHDLIGQELAKLDSMPLAERVAAINELRIAIHKKSPFVTEPVDCVVWVPGDKVQANDYNPNVVAPPEMRLLEVSISEDGYTQPIVSFSENGHYEVVDGFHRCIFRSRVISPAIIKSPNRPITLGSRFATCYFKPCRTKRGRTTSIVSASSFTDGSSEDIPRYPKRLR